VAKYKPIDDNEILRLSLIGLGQQLANTNAAITGIRSRLGIRGVSDHLKSSFFEPLPEGNHIIRAGGANHPSDHQRTN
jgi:hypothetical protein